MKPIAYLFTQNSDVSVGLFHNDRFIGFWRGAYLPPVLEVLKSLYQAGALDIHCQDEPAKQTLAGVDTFQSILEKLRRMPPLMAPPFVGTPTPKDDPADF